MMKSTFRFLRLVGNSSSSVASSKTATVRPLQRIARCSTLPNVNELLRADFEATFKAPLASSTDTATFLHDYVGKSDEVIPYTTTMMRVFTDLGALEDMRLIFAMAINELSSAMKTVPEELYRIYLFSISETDTFTRDEVTNILSLIQNTGIQLSLISKLCILELVLKLGIDPLEHVGNLAEEYHDKTLSTVDIELLYKKCDSLLHTVLLSHYSAQWATEVFKLCSSLQISVSDRIINQLFRLCLSEPTIHPIHVLKGAWIILSNPKATGFNLSDSDIVKIAVRCRQWRSLEAINSLQKLLFFNRRLKIDSQNSVSEKALHRVFAVVTITILSEMGRLTEAIRLLPLLRDSADAAYSPYPCVFKGIIVSETHPAYFIATTLAQLGTTVIDETYYNLIGSEKISSVSEETNNESKIDKTTHSSNLETSSEVLKVNDLTTEMMDVIIAACSLSNDEERALETFNIYPAYNVPYSSDSFLHMLSSVAATSGPAAAVRRHRSNIGHMIALGIEPSSELLRTMLFQSLECNDIDSALWCIKLNGIYKKTIDRGLSLKLLSKIVAGRDREAGGFILKIIDETSTNVDSNVLNSFKSDLSL